MKQNKCTTAMPLGKTRIWLDFNEFCAIEKEDEAPIYFFSQADIVNNSDGNDIMIYDGMEVSVFDEDFDKLYWRSKRLTAQYNMMRTTA